MATWTKLPASGQQLGLPIRGHSPHWLVSSGSAGRRFGGDVVIQAGMEFQFEPNAVFGRDYVDVGGNILVTEMGCEELNHMPTEMCVVR